MSTLTMSVDQTSRKNHTLTAIVVRNTTSLEESKNNALNYTLVCPLKEILKINIDENLRIAYGDSNTSKKETSIHRDIRESFEEAPDRFIQRHSGFSVVCDDLNVASKQDGGISQVTLTNASLINGAQTQRVLKDIISNYPDEAYSKYNVRVEVIVEKNRPERIEIAIARNTTNNVSDLSQMGKKTYFNSLDDSCKSVLGIGVQRSETETDGKIPTQTLLQILRTMVPKSIRSEGTKDMQALDKSTVKAYSGKTSVLREYKKYKDAEEEGSKLAGFESPILKFYREFAPYAWQTFEAWQSDPDWIELFNKNLKAGAKRIGKYDEDTKDFNMGWAVLCPVLYGLQHFLKETSDGWRIDQPSSFDKKNYMKKVFDLLKDKEFNPQEFAKDKGVYLELYIYVSENSWIEQ